MNEYPIVVFWSAEDDAHIADVPDVRYCSAPGETSKAALRDPGGAGEHAGGDGRGGRRAPGASLSHNPPRGVVAGGRPPRPPAARAATPG